MAPWSMCALSWVSVATTPSCPSSVSRRLSRIRKMSKEQRTKKTNMAMNAQRESRYMMKRDGVFTSVSRYLASFKKQDVKMNSTKATEEIENALQNSTIVRK
ncbi:hypothetical protein EDB92DRAFT_1879019 [Lactarius akahatsu]|uniref:Uncharacterized protein n=1 Tax=Lactarius akahatsu TaxID=416441 RepID=A0AAD4QBB2_9AGAM|nr:hypothetical protein EDB92DRAFT_1879019 [Lactarius akahatsu]